MSPHMPGPGCHKNIGLTQMGIDCLYTFLTSLSHDIWFYGGFDMISPGQGYEDCGSQALLKRRKPTIQVII
ncbi:hypothetical protein NC652_018866 [Populus alba x Populus x berolinensis]|nr:hypothetical protein NC652_018866 [Populus alba x Populus x berolinensis]